MSAPFHSLYLESATRIILEGRKEIEAFHPAGSRNCCFPHPTGHDLRDGLGNESIISELVNMTTQQPVHWEAATVFSGATHIPDPGPGSISGLGVLTHHNKDGTGVRVIIAGAFGGTGNGVGCEPELFD